MTAGGAGGGIGGDPSVVESGADGVAEAAKSITATGQLVRSHGDNLVNGWVGSTSDAAYEVLRWLSERTDVGGEVVGSLPKILDDYASELRAAQEAYATAVAQAVAARAALANVRTLEAGSGFAATTPVRPEAFGAAPPSALEAGAIEDVDAASDALAAAIAREQLANRTAAEGVNTLTGELSGMTLDVVEAYEAALPDQEARGGATGAGPEKSTGEVMAQIYSGNVLDIDFSDPEALDQEALRNSFAGAGDRAYDIGSDTVSAGYMLTPAGAMAAPWALPAYDQQSARLKNWFIEAGGADPAASSYRDGQDAAEAASWAFAATGLARGATAGAPALARGITGKVAERAFKAQTEKRLREGFSVGLVSDARYAQKKAGLNFSETGTFDGAPVSEIADQLRSGALTRNDLPIDTIRRDGYTLILNTRSSQALEKAGIPREEWIVKDQSGVVDFEARLDGQLVRNRLDSSGISELRPRTPQ